MENELKNDLITAWNEIDEALANFDLNNQEFIAVKSVTKQRLVDARNWLGKYVSEDDVLLEI